MSAIDEYKNNFILRYDYVKYLKYFNTSNFKGLNSEEFTFYSSHKDVIKGYIYSYDGYDPKKLIIFVHGLGPGHLSYFKEIEYLCKNGFKVLAYDMTGTGKSEGANIYGLSQALADLDYVIDYVKGHNDFKDLKLSIVGHSLGAYAALNIAYYKPEIKNIVAISGFESISTMCKMFGVEGSEILNYEKHINPGYAMSLGIESIDSFKGNMLIIHSSDDYMLSPEVGISYIKNKAANKKVKYMMLNDKGHNPNYTTRAVKYMKDTMADFNTKVSNGIIKSDEEKIEYFNTVDFNKMTEQDDKVFKEIINLLNS